MACFSVFLSPSQAHNHISSRLWGRTTRARRREEGLLRNDSKEVGSSDPTLCGRRAKRPRGMGATPRGWTRLPYLLILALYDRPTFTTWHVLNYPGNTRV